MNADRSPSSNASSPDIGQLTPQVGGRRSLIFFYYHNVTETVTSCGGYISATCNICWVVLRGNKGVTSNFVSHLRRRHPSHYSAFVQCRAEQAACPDSSVSPQIINIDNSPPDPNDALCYEVEECIVDSGHLPSEVAAEIHGSYCVDSTSQCVGDFRQTAPTTNTSEHVEASRASRAFVNRPEVGLSRLATAITSVPNTIPFLVPLTSCYTSPTTTIVNSVKTLQVSPKPSSVVQSNVMPLSQTSLFANDVRVASVSKQELVTRSLTKYVVQSLSPLCIVEETSFQQLIRELQPGCSVTSEFDLRVNILPEMTEKAVSKISNELRHIETVSLSVNSGNASNGSGPYQAVTVHFVKEGRLLSALLTCEMGGGGEDFVAQQICKYQLESKSYKTVSDIFESVSYKLLHPVQEEQIFREEEHEALERADGSSPCFERNFEDVIKTALRNSSVVSDVLEKASLIHERSKRTRKIGSSQLSRGWNRDLKDIRELLQKTPFESNAFTHSERALLEELSSILEPFEEVMDMVRTEQTVPISLVLPSLVSIKKLLDSQTDTVQNLRDVLVSLRNQLDRKFVYVFKDKMYTVAAFLDPRFKLSWCGDDVEERRALDTVRNAVSSGGVGASERSLLESTSKDVGSLPEPPKKKIFLQLRHNTARKQSCVDEELKIYLEEPLEDERIDPIRFWYERGRGSKPLPILSKLSDRVFSVPATSSPITRIFDSVQNNHRPDDLQKLIFLKANLDFWTK